MVDIGQRLGRRDHTTVIHALQTIPHRIKHEEACSREWRLICERLGVGI
jgi:chromosomal replication initiation ATPase DnaA